MPCTVHKQKGEMPAFEGYSREEEERLQEFAQDELCQLLYHKKQARFFSKEMQLLADPEFDDDPPTPPPRRGKKKKKKTEAVQADPPAAAPKRRQTEGAEEVPAPAPSPFRAPCRTPRASPSPASKSNNLGDWADFWVEEPEDDA